MPMTKDFKEALTVQFRFLAFKEAKPDLVHHRNLYIGMVLLFTWLAGIGRYWDNPKAHLWQHLGLGSLAYIFLMALLIWLTILPLKPIAWTYLKVWTFVGLTSLPGVLYAIPVERFMSMEASQAMNVLFLAIVATWRVSLLFSFLTRVARLNIWSMLVGALLPIVLIITALTALNLEHVVFNIMGGIRTEDISANDASYGILFVITLFSITASPVFLLSYLIEIYRIRFKKRTHPS